MNRPAGRFLIYTHLIWWAVVGVGVLSWILLVPWVFGLQPPLADRVRWYGLLILALLPLLTALHHLQLGPLYRLWPRVQSGELPRDQMPGFVKRLADYPLRFSLLFLLGGILLATVMAAIQSRRYATPPLVSGSLLLAGLAHMLPLATLGYYLSRRGVERFLRLPPAYTSPKTSGPSLAARCLPGLVVAALTAWLVFASQLLLELSRAPAGEAAVRLQTTWPFLLSGAAALGWCLTLAGVLMRRLQRRSQRIMDYLEVLAESRELGFSTGFVMENSDELAELEEAFNLVYETMCQQAMQLRSAALDAREAHKRQLELIGVVCHNLRTPIHSIVGFSQLLLDREGDLSEEQRGFVSSILRSSHHLLGLVDDVVDFSKMESGVLGVVLTRADGRKVAQEAVDAGALLAAGKLQIRARLPEDLPHLRADETRLRQILLNLISNAVKYAGRGVVLVSARPEGAQVRFTIEDEGPGLPEEYLQRIFQEYERAASGNSSAGTGLGLAITRRLVEMHGGMITAGNRPEGGAVLSFTIPQWKSSGGAK